MEHRLFVLLLLTGVLPLVLSVARKYYLIQQEKTWSDAQVYCRATYTDLATIDSNKNMVKLQNVAQTQLFSSSAWIGLYSNINRWQWSFENEPLGNFTSWYILEPNNLMGNDWCVFIYGGKWFDAPCYWMLFFVCFDDRKTGTNSYILISEAKTWSEAQSYCRQQHTDLASGRNATENSVVGGKNYWGFTWFGLNRDPWKWSDQTTNMSIITWWAGNADDYLKNKSCGYLYGGLADEAQCSEMKPFFCYLFPKQQQIIRVKVKSSQDANDPAIMAAILEKIKQKLKDQGMAENITVKWREQPDGVVFHKEKENITTVVNNTRDAGDL